ncbi:hypothetical protein DSUL_140090 [Desulfovibrionales bacterium]
MNTVGIAIIKARDQDRLSQTQVEIKFLFDQRHIWPYSRV